MKSAVEALAVVADALGDLRQEAVFVGAAVLPFYLDRAVAAQVRATYDVDFAFNIEKTVDLLRRQGELRDRGFEPAMDEDPPLTCRFRVRGIKVDMVSAHANAAQPFSNRWYSRAFAYPIQHPIDGTHIFIPEAPIYLAMKLEAFNSRGKSDYRASTDLEDVIALIEGCSSLAAEVYESDPDLQDFVAETFAELLLRPAFTEYLRGTVTRGPGLGERAQIVVERMTKMAKQ